MAKIDTAKEIVAEFPEKNFEAEQLVDDYTQDEQDQLQKDLRAEREEELALAPDTQAVSSEQEVSKKKYKLRDPSTSYQEVGFTLAGDQEKELPEDPSSFLLGYIKAGYIIEVE